MKGIKSLILASSLSAIASALIMYSSLAVLVGGDNIVTSIDLSPFLGGSVCMSVLVVDRVSAVFLLILGVIGLTSSVHGMYYIKHYVGRGSLRIYSLTYPLFLLSMYLALVVTDVIAFIISWEVMTIASFFLISFEMGREEARKAALKYLLMSYPGSLLMILALLTLASVGGTTSYQGLVGLKLDEISKYLIKFFLIVGFGIKAALVPTHSWLPDAHPEAPSNVSALLSGVMIKMAVYGILRFGISLHIFDVRVFGIILASLGTLSIFYGASLAITQDDLKKLMAYSSIAQIGYIFLGIGAGLSSFDTLMGITALAAGVLHILNHAISKGLLFLTAGNIIYSTGTRNLNVLGGLAKYMPATFTSGLIGSLAISGVPPLNCFVSKWLIILSTLLLGNPLIAVYACIALLGSALTTAAFVKFVVRAFMSGGKLCGGADEVPRPMYLATMSLAVLCVVLGVYPYITLLPVLRALTSILAHPMMLSTYLLDGLLSVSLTFLVILAVTASSALITAYVLRGKTRLSSLWVFGARNLHSEVLSLNAQSYYSEFQRVYGYAYVCREFIYRFVVNPLTSWFIRVVGTYDKFDTPLYTASYTILFFLTALIVVVLALITGW